MTDFFRFQMDYVQFLSGLTYFILAGACFALRETDRKSYPWNQLGFFGIGYGLKEWLDILIISSEEYGFLLLFRFLLLITSWFFAINFGRTGMIRLKGKGPGSWIFIPLLLPALFGGLFWGWNGLNITTSFALGPLGGFGAAGVFFWMARQINTRKSFWLKAGGLGMGCFGLATAFMAVAGPFLPAQLLTSNPFLKWSGFPIQVFQGGLILLTALSLSIYSILTIEEETKGWDDFRKKSRMTFGITFFSLLVIFFSGWIGTQLLGDWVLTGLKKENEAHLQAISNRLMDRMDHSARMVRVLSGSSWILPALMTRSAADLQRANEVLDRYQQALKVSVCYLLDNQGLTIASSNRNEVESFVGKSYSFRPYFQKAFQGEVARYLALGVTSRERGYYAGFAVRGTQREIVGVVVIKDTIHDLEAGLKRGDITFFVDPHGIIFMSSHPEMVLKSIRPLKIDEETHLLQSRQFGSQGFQALWAKEPLHGDIVQFRDRDYLVSRRPVGDEGWSVLLFSSLSKVGNYRLFGIILTFSLSLLVLGSFVTLQRSAESAFSIAISENRFREIFENSPEATFIYDSITEEILSANTMMAHWLGYSLDELIRMKLTDILDPQGEEGVERRFQKKDGTWVDVLLTNRTHFPFRGKSATLTIARDISERKRYESMLERFSFIDGLTGIANRRHFDLVLEKEWRRCRREKNPISLIMIDIDHFKTFNDTYGHQAGDDCLKEVARALKETLKRSADLAARYGGEEFAVILPTTEPESAYRVAEALRTRIADLGIPHTNSPIAKWLTVSLGVATSVPDPENSFSRLVTSADQALYQAKAGGRNRVVVYGSE